MGRSDKSATVELATTPAVVSAIKATLLTRRYRAVLFTVPASVIGQYSSDDVTAREGDTVVLTCNVTGVPKPEVTWYRRHRSASDVTYRRQRT